MKELMFLRLRTQDDVIGYTTDNGETVSVEKPLLVDIEYFMEEGKQFIAMREYVPQSIVDLTEAVFPKTDIMFMYKVREEFAREYVELSDMFYQDQPKVKSTKKRNLSDAAEKVVSLMDALTEKKDKPIH